MEDDAVMAFLKIPDSELSQTFEMRNDAEVRDAGAAKIPLILMSL